MQMKTRRLINREASAVARQYGVTPSLAFLAQVREIAHTHTCPGCGETDSRLMVESCSPVPLDEDALRREAQLAAYVVADCFQPHPTCLSALECKSCAAAVEDGVAKGY